MTVVFDPFDLVDLRTKLEDTSAIILFRIGGPKTTISTIFHAEEDDALGSEFGISFLGDFGAPGLRPLSPRESLEPAEP